MRIAPYGTGNVVRTGVICLLIAFSGILLPQPGGSLFSVAAIFFFLFTLFFYRDPERTIPDQADLIRSPADGTVVLKQTIDHPVTGPHSTLISIFMSPINVHVNRAPFSGTIVDVRHQPGKYLMAFDHRSMSDNEHTEITLETTIGAIWFCQVSGFLARRIVCNLSAGQEVSTGERFGMIKLGSRVDMVLPSTVQVTAETGMKTRAGITVLGQAG